jgi:tRNA(Ile)-lysidine synthetase-like protein
MEYYIKIYNFWKNNPKYWISIQNKKEADKKIYELFYPYDYYIDDKNNFNKQTFIGYIIYLDQIKKHIYDYLNVNMIGEMREIAVKLLNNMDLDFFLNLTEDELYFCLMPYKHQKQYEICFNYCKEWSKYNNKKIKELPIISKFFNDTYKKVYSNVDNIHLSSNYINNYDSKEICCYYPYEYINKNWYENNNKKFTNLQQEIQKQFNFSSTNQIIVSISGGVDSMTMLFLLKMLKINVIAVHINYSNRDVSGQEHSFIATYCNKLNIPLYSYCIEWLKRDEVDRDFYEEITKIIRFNVYKKVSNNPIVLLGHIKEDIIENIWTNIGKCEHLHNLKKMVYSEYQYGIKIIRPMLNISKEKILKLSKKFCIPFLNNTTPSWSKRGQFREKFYLEIKNYYSQNIDNNIIRFSEIIQKQYEIINKTIFEPILNSFDNNVFNITNAVNADIGLDNWKYLIEIICHKKYGINKPSIHSIKNFYQNITKKYNFKCHMRKEYDFIVYTINNLIYLKIIL